jgi:hypothetical protein
MISALSLAESLPENEAIESKRFHSNDHNSALAAWGTESCMKIILGPQHVAHMCREFKNHIG